MFCFFQPKRFVFFVYRDSCIVLLYSSSCLCKACVNESRQTNQIHPAVFFRSSWRVYPKYSNWITFFVTLLCNVPGTLDLFYWSEMFVDCHSFRSCRSVNLPLYHDYHCTTWNLNLKTNICSLYVYVLCLLPHALSVIKENLFCVSRI